MPRLPRRTRRRRPERRSSPPSSAAAAALAARLARPAAPAWTAGAPARPGALVRLRLRRPRPPTASAATRGGAASEPSSGPATHSARAAGSTPSRTDSTTRRGTRTTHALLAPGPLLPPPRPSTPGARPAENQPSRLRLAGWDDPGALVLHPGRPPSTCPLFSSRTSPTLRVWGGAVGSRTGVATGEGGPFKGVSLQRDSEKSGAREG